MNEITSDAAVIAALRRQMTIAAAKQVGGGGNLANVDTPGYQGAGSRLRPTRSTSKLGDDLRLTDSPKHICAGVEPSRPRPRKSKACRRAATATPCSSIASC